MGESVADFFRRGQDAAHAVSTFTNRVAELQLFTEVLTKHQGRLAQIDPLDPDAARDNVLNFFGVGGIGKSSTLRSIERTLAETDPPVAHVLIDFHRPSSFNVEDVVLRLRIALGEIGVRCTAFDVALTFYWGVVHPGESIEAYTRRNSLLQRAADKIGLSDQVESSVMELASSLLSVSSAAHGAARLTQVIARLATDRRNVRHAIADCEVLEAFLDPTTIEQNLTYLPALLAWDLSRSPGKSAVVLWDTYEEVTERGRQVERLFQRLCFVMPNVLFVVAGRNALDWAEPRLHGALDYVGGHVWPKLDRSGPAEMSRLVGDFSFEDSTRYLADRLQLDGQPAIPEGARNAIAVASGGWPLYLDTAIGYCQQQLAEGGLVAGNVAVAFPALVSRLASDLTHEERRALRGCALFRAFDHELARAAAGEVSDAAVSSLLARNFVKYDATNVWPYSLHPALVQAVRADVEGREAWTQRDWKEAAERVMTALEQRAHNVSDARELGLCVNLGLRLAHEHDLYRGWLSTSVRRLSALGSLAVIRSVGEPTEPAAALARLAVTLVESHNQPHLNAAATITDSLVPALGDGDRHWARLRIAGALMSGGAIEAAAEEYRELIDDPSVAAEIATDAATMFALILLKRSEFIGLAATVEAQHRLVDTDRLMGDLHRYHANWQLARSHYLSGLSRAVARGDAGLQRLYEAELALVEGWTGQRPEPRVDATDPGSTEWTDVAFRVADALGVAGSDPDAANDLLDAAESIATTFGFSEAHADVTVARAFVATLHDDRPALDAAAERLAQYCADTGTYASWLHVVCTWRGDTDPPPAPVGWLGSSSVPHSWTTTRDQRITP